MMEALDVKSITVLRETFTESTTGRESRNWCRRSKASLVQISLPPVAIQQAVKKVLVVPSHRQFLSSFV